jgi:hypothetical protein
MHVRKKKKKAVYFCTTRHLLGKAKCSNARGLPVEHADRALLNAFEEALAGQIVLSSLEECLDEHRRQSMDPEPLRAEAEALKREISRLVAGLAKGDLVDIHDAVRARKARLEHLEGQLEGIGAARDFDLKDSPRS